MTLSNFESVIVGYIFQKGKNLPKINDCSFSVRKAILQTVVCSDIFGLRQKRYKSLRLLRYYIRAFSHGEAVYRAGLPHIATFVISLVLCTNIVEAHFLTKCASSGRFFVMQ